MLDPEAAHIDPVEPEPGQRGRKRPRRHQAFFAPGGISYDITDSCAEPGWPLQFIEYLNNAQFQAQAIAERIAPVVEVAGDDDGFVTASRILHALDQRLRLAPAADFEQVSSMQCRMPRCS